MASYKRSDYESLRNRCVELSNEDWEQTRIAKAFGLTQGWVSQTLKKYREGGGTALQEGKRTGAPTRLSDEQLVKPGLSYKNGQVAVSPTFVVATLQNHDDLTLPSQNYHLFSTH